MHAQRWACSVAPRLQVLVAVWLKRTGGRRPLPPQFQPRRHVRHRCCYVRKVRLTKKGPIPLTGLTLFVCALLKRYWLPEFRLKIPIPVNPRPSSIKDIGSGTELTPPLTDVRPACLPVESTYNALTLHWFSLRRLPVFITVLNPKV